ncbi:MAG: GAF domain-containing protein [Calditrichota bacterium]
MKDTSPLSRDSLELLVEAAQALLEEPGLERLTPRLLDKAFAVSGAERGYLLLRSAGGELTPVMARGMEPGSLPEGDPSKAIIETALRERRPILSQNAARDHRFSGSESIIIRGIRSACCIPLEARGSRLGALYLDASGSGKFSECQLPALEAFGSLAALALARAMEYEDARIALQVTVGGLGSQALLANQRSCGGFTTAWNVSRELICRF